VLRKITSWSKRVHKNLFERDLVTTNTPDFNLPNTPELSG
jgi:hypothetical protein